jgi:cytidylate kinase
MSLITISHSTGSGGYQIAQMVARSLDLELFDDLRLQQEASKLGISEDDIRGMNEKAPGFFDQIFNRKPEMYLEFMEALVYEVARKGTGVIIGHGSQMLLRDFGCALHVSVQAPEQSRIETFKHRNNLSREVAEKLIRKSDRERNGFFRFAFQLDVNDPGLYDLVINTGKMSLATAATLIVETARADEMKECSLGALDAMVGLSMERKIRAALHKNGISPKMLHFEATAEGVVQIRGISSARQLKDQIVSVVQNVPGVKKVKADISVVDRAYY